VPFLVVENDWRITITPLTTTISPNTYNKNFEIAILFDVVKTSINYAFEDDTAPKDLRARVVSYVLGLYTFFL
jgi:hypothetical protein